jgi:cell division protein FtsL
MSRINRAACFCLAFVVVASAIALVYSRYRSRILFAQTEALNKERDELGIEWGRLQIEQATWSENSRVEKIAREDLGLAYPQPGQMVVLP